MAFPTGRLGTRRKIGMSHSYSWELGTESEKYLYSIGLNSNELGLKLKF